jgi:tRNA-modifying protein YgfZ
MNSAALLQGQAHLPQLGVIRAIGPDAAHFLHNQLTQDVLLLPADQARLAGYCSAKGRLLASFVAWVWAPDEIVLVCSADLLAASLKRLSMYVMRSKVKLSDASADFAIFGLAGDAALAATAGPKPAWHKSHAGPAQVVNLYPALGQARALWLAPTDAPPPPADALPHAVWQWGEVHSGVAMVTQALSELFVPQMLNYESIGGVNFKKGCYPGQEVVARSQFRGTLKRRAFLAHADFAPGPAPAETIAVGQAVFHSADAEQACGTVVAAAPHPAGGYDLLVSMQISASESGVVTVGGPTGAALQFLSLPYALLGDI